MEIVTSWEEKGEAQGVIKGQRQLVERQLLRKLGTLPERTLAQLADLSSAQLNVLGEDLLDFATLAELAQWLVAHPALDGV